MPCLYGTHSHGCYLFLLLRLPAALWIREFLPPLFPCQTEVNRVKSLALSCIGCQWPNCSCCLSVMHRDVRAMSFSGRSQIELKVLFLTKNTMFQKLLFKKKNSFQTNFRPFLKNKWLKCQFSQWTFICSIFSRAKIWKGHEHRHSKIPRLFPTISPHFNQIWGSVLHQCCLFPTPCLH